MFFSLPHIDDVQSVEDDALLVGDEVIDIDNDQQDNHHIPRPIPLNRQGKTWVLIF